MAKKIRIEYLKVESGIAVPIAPEDAKDKEDLLAKAGKIRPSADETITIPGKVDWLGRPRRVALYPSGSAKPWPVARENVVNPDSLKDHDLMRLFGPYISGMIQRALKLNEKITAKDIWLFCLSGGALLVSIITLAVCVKAFRTAGLL